MLEQLFTPNTIAVIGASRTPGKVGHDILKNLVQGGFAGEIVAINPAAQEVLGRPCFADISKSGKTVDLAIIAVPKDHVKIAVKDAINGGAKAVVVVAAGFKELGREGLHREQEIAELCAGRGVRLLGPNCLGLINTAHKMNASFAGAIPMGGSISVISQSGALSTAILDLAMGRHLGLAKIVSIGNKADISEVDLLRYLARDEQTKVIAGYLEDIISGDDFIKAAEEAASNKPVVILKSGTTTAGMKAEA